MATPVLNNGIFLRDTSYQASSLYGEPLGDGAVPVRVHPSKRRKRLAALAAINRAMSAKLRERKEAAAKGLEEMP